MRKIAKIHSFFNVVNSYNTGFSSANIYKSFVQISHSEAADVTPVAVYIMMTKNNQGTDIFSPKIQR